MLSWLLLFSYTVIKTKATTCGISGIPGVCYSVQSNPCDASNPQNYYPSCTSHCHYIQCDGGSNSFDMPCAPGTFWDPSLNVYGACSHIPTQNSVTGASYFMGPDKLTWHAAKTYCESQGSTLASIHSKADLDTVSALCNTYSSGNDECHIGMRLNAPNGKWKWIDNTASNYGFNSNGNPVFSRPPWEAEYAYDGCHFATCSTQDAFCHMVDVESDGNGYFCDIRCSETKPPICNGAATGGNNCDHNYAFVIDESGSVGLTNYIESIDFVIDLIENNIDITAQLMALAFSTAGDNDYIHTFINQQNPRAAIISALETEKTDYAQGGATYTKQALQAVLNEFINQGYTSNNIIILVTDGKPHDGPCNDNVLRDALVAQGIRVVIVGVAGIGGFSATAVECLVNGNAADIIEINSFDFDPVIAQLQQGEIVCTICAIGGTPPVCYDTDTNNPCNPLIQTNPDVYYYSSCTGHCHFIQCDAFGRAFDMPTAPGTVWDQSIIGINYPPQSAKTISALNDMNDFTNVETKSNYYGYIVLIGVIAFILMNNIFIGCWCVGKGRNKAHAKFDMVSVNDEI